MRGPFESNMGEVVRDAVLAGLGISLHSTWHVCDDLKAGRLQVVLPDYRIPDSGIYAVMPQRRLMETALANGRKHSPTIATLRRYAAALGYRVQVRFVKDKRVRNGAWRGR